MAALTWRPRGAGYKPHEENIYKASLLIPTISTMSKFQHSALQLFEKKQSEAFNDIIFISLKLQYIKFY